jgi:hypothetical protein
MKKAIATTAITTTTTTISTAITNGIESIKSYKNTTALYTIYKALVGWSSRGHTCQSSYDLFIISNYQYTMRPARHPLALSLQAPLFAPVFALSLALSYPVLASIPDHQEFEASLNVPFRFDPQLRSGDEARYFTLNFEFPLVAHEQAVTWRVELLAPNGQVVERWYGIESLWRQPVAQKILWGGRKGGNLADGLYHLRLSAKSNEANLVNRSSNLAQTVEQWLAKGTGELIVQSWPLQVGGIKQPALPAFNALPRHSTLAASGKTGNATNAAKASSSTTALAGNSIAATGSLPYTIALGNLHSQTNHSDGGGNLATCVGAQAPQSGLYGPSDAYLYGMNHGLDILMASEHNHMADGSDSTNTAASPTTAKNRYQSGLTQAAQFNTAHPNFLAIYGLEWGVISNGGHLNIFNTNELLEWEYNSSNQLIGDTYTAKGDYAALYTLMKQRGWIGQFNHPAVTGQFQIGGVPLAYHADGDASMALCEVLDSGAFATSTTESDTGLISYEAACNFALEAGYHVAFSTNQDNHCANWGAAYTNRTGVLIPNGTALTQTSFLDALKARRVYASMDKNSQLILTGNGHLMGERFANSGPLTLTSLYASSAGRTAATIAIYEGVPGRRGTVTQLASTASTSFTPAAGEHFYYAKVTQDDGKMLWSAPIWVTQGTGSDSAPPSVSASESGSSGTITLSATASDNVGVARVEFYVDNVLKGSDSSAPYSLTLNSTTLTNSSHSLIAKAFDAANNSASSSSVSFTISNTSTQLITNGGFESAATGWTASAGVIDGDTTQAAHSGSYKASLNGYGSAHTDTLYQSISIPASASTVSLGFWLKVVSSETSTTTAWDTLKVQVQNSSGTVLSTLATYSNLNKGSTWVNNTFDLAAWKGQTVRIAFVGVEGTTVATSFLLDDVSVTAQ